MAIRGNSLQRPYDAVIPAATLSKIVERRRSPDGLLHQVPEVKRAGRRVYSYPWAKMELGDFFIISLEGRKERAVRIGLFQAAARYDFEIAITPTSLDGFPALRVCVTVIGVTGWKLKAEKEGVTGITYSDGRWRGRKRQWEADNRKKGKPKAPRTADQKRSAFWADNDPELPAPEMVAPPEVKLSRADVIKRALAAEGASQ